MEKKYHQLDATELAEKIAAGEMKTEDVLETAIERIEKINPKLNSVIIPLYDYGRKAVRAGLPDGPFKGVPILIKDLVSTIEGAPLYKGTKGLKNAGYIAPRDSELIKRIKAAGFVIIGKTNTPEFGLMGTTEPESFGPSRNPWNTEHSTGGSSGGSGAAVAAGFTPIATGGDGGGSIRIPASCCNLFGLKPSRGRTPASPYGEIWQGAAIEHVLTRSVRDSAAILDILSGDAPGAPYEIRPPVRPYAEEIKTDPGKMKIGYCLESPLKNEIDAENRKAVLKTVDILRDFGHEVEEVAIPYDGERLLKSFLLMYAAEVAAEIDELANYLGRPARRADVEPGTWALGLLGRLNSSADLVAALNVWHETAREMGQFHIKYDIFLTPTTASPPVKIGVLPPTSAEKSLLAVINLLGAGRVLKATGAMETAALRSLEKLPFTQLANLTGQPAASVPIAFSESGLPIGVQLVAAFGGEDKIFRLAAQLENKSESHRRPDVD